MYVSSLQQVQNQKGVTSVADELAKYDPNKKYKYEQLKGTNNCPPGVDPTNKEVRGQMGCVPTLNYM